MNTRVAVCLFALLVLGPGCGNDASVSKVRESVLGPGLSVEVANKYGSIRINYVSPTKRSYVWDNHSKIVQLIPRTDRWRGALGLYNPADAWSFVTIFLPRLVVQEAEQHFNNIEEAEKFLMQGSNYMDWVYTDDGFVVGYGKTPSRQQVNIDIWQIYINGLKPNKLPGARASSITLKQER